VISDRQILRSKGKVRCSSCRERFVARRFREESDKNDQLKEGGEQHANAPETEKVDVSDQRNGQESDEVSAVGYELSPFTEEVESETTIERESSEPEPDQSIKTPFSRYETSFEENLQSELTIEMESELFEQIEANSFITTAEYSNQDEHSDQQLISEVDKLIEGMFLDDTQSTIEMLPSTEMEFEEALSERNPWRRWLFTPLLSLLAVLLISALLYQLWHRQALPWLEGEKLSQAIAPIAQPLVGKLSEEFGVTLPVRRDLRSLQLLSAHTETHPTRSSTLLLKVRIINHSTIAQPFPWLELALTDENGRLVARRALSPEDYLHNNRLTNSIASKEVRPVTIEFLSFPEHVHGYELKLLNN
jgi:hypothetical protein